MLAAERSRAALLRRQVEDLERERDDLADAIQQHAANGDRAREHFARIAKAAGFAGEDYTELPGTVARLRRLLAEVLNLAQPMAGVLCTCKETHDETLGIGCRHDRIAEIRREAGL
jgi:predicted nuclease with TOPRIM domain